MKYVIGLFPFWLCAAICLEQQFYGAAALTVGCAFAFQFLVME